MAAMVDSTGLTTLVFNLYLERLSILSKALEIQSSVGSSQQSLPPLTDFFPSTIEEAEIQQFNLSLIIPSRFQNNDEAAAMWILEKECLDRQQVASFILDRVNPTPQSILMKIATKVASIEVGQEFADGLKFFLPVVGMWERCFPEHTDYDEATLRYVLQIYCRAHIQFSKKHMVTMPLSALDDLVEVAWVVVDLLRVLSSSKKPQAQAMTDFFSSIRAALRHSTTITMSIRSMTDLFISASGSLARSVRIPSSAPSFLFASSKLAGVVSLSFSFRDTFQPYYTRVCSDAIYFFHLHGLCDDLYGCIPLRSMHCQRCSNSGNLDLLEIFDYAGGRIPFILFQKEIVKSIGSEGEEIYTGYFPSDVAFHDRVLLEINSKRNRLDPHVADATRHHPMHQHAQQEVGAMKNSHDVSVFEDADLRYVEDWVDVLETCAWECRAAKRSVSIATASSAHAASSVPPPPPPASSAQAVSAADPISLL